MSCFPHLQSIPGVREYPGPLFMHGQVHSDSPRPSQFPAFCAGLVTGGLLAIASFLWAFHLQGGTFNQSIPPVVELSSIDSQLPLPSPTPQDETVI